jgi:hypothetical protein
MLLTLLVLGIAYLVMDAGVNLMKRNWSSSMSTSSLHMLLLSLIALSGHGALATEYRPNPTVDRNGWIDVWQLRIDLAQVEPLIASEETDHCYPEGDADDHADAKSPSAMERRRQEHLQRQFRAQAEKCEATVRERYAAYKKAYEAFNAAWLPVLLNAVKKGDKVAEVILLRCDTTPVIDRTKIISTCDPQGRGRAEKRLREIGFRPAIDVESEPGFCESPHCGARSPQGRATLRSIVLNALKYANFGSLPYEATGYWEVKDDPRLERQLKLNARIIEAARQDVGRAFRFQIEGRCAGDDTSSLQLNRDIYRPTQLTWGPELFVSDGNPRAENHWRSISKYCTSDGEHSLIENDLNRLRQTTEANVAEYLKQDSRWAVFLMNRLGHHEWVPQGLEEKAANFGKLDSSWLGHWELVRNGSNFGPLSDYSEGAGTADIVQNGNSTRITIRTKRKPDRPQEDVTDCNLRYSGGLTFYSENGNLHKTPLGDATGLRQVSSGEQSTWLNAEGKLNGLEPLEHNKRYKQVLMQCAAAEMPDNDRVRFLLLAGDTLIEVAAEWPRCHGVLIRHFKRPSGDGSSLAKAAERVEVPVAPSEADARLIRFDGVYQSPPVMWRSEPHWTYLRFYPDGRVIQVRGTTGTPHQIKSWFVPEHDGLDRGIYRVREANISFTLHSDGCWMTYQGMIDGDEIRTNWSGMCPGDKGPATGNSEYKFAPL